MHSQLLPQRNMLAGRVGQLLILKTPDSGLNLFERRKRLHLFGSIDCLVNKSVADQTSLHEK